MNGPKRLILVAGAEHSQSLVLLVDDPYTRQLRLKMTFMVVSSIICVGLGVCFALGAAAVRKRWAHK